MRSNTLLLLSALFAVLCFNGCKKDPCANTYCRNGGTCFQGDCDCPAGYRGLQCETYDACLLLSCLNGGTCVSGFCNCLTGYSGTNCGTVLTPVSMTITKIVLNDFPPSDGGFYWDPASGAPDIYLSVNLGITANTNEFTSGTQMNAADGISITYTNLFPITLTFPDNNYTIGLWDWDDLDADDFMGGIYFTPNNHDTGFPSEFSLTTASIDMRLFVTWNF